jgi:16S rRNA (adenine1518-N6/adenine1519-N6)-dimethyltransferase
MNHRPRKRWGQNFLHDRRAIERIMDAIAPAAGDVILEIGPGEGVLTRPLLATGATVHAVEIDRDLAAKLDQWPQAGTTLHVHVGDALAFDPAAVAAAGPVRVVGNLPYNISTPILFHLLARRAHIRDLHLMLQREVVDRMAAPAGAHARGRLSVMLQAWCRVEPLLHLPPGAFRPPPRVDSTVVRLRLLDQPLVPPEHERAFADLVRLAFGGRRKTLRRTLAPRLDAETIAAQGVDPGLRPERLEVAAFAALAAACDPLPTD